MSFHETHAASTEGSHSWARLDGVDILRGLAIFFVLMNHVNMRLFLANDSVHARSSLPTGVLIGVEWTTTACKCSCGVRLSHHVNLNSTMGIALKSKRA